MIQAQLRSSECCNKLLQKVPWTRQQLLSDLKVVACVRAGVCTRAIPPRAKAFCAFLPASHIDLKLYLFVEL